MGAAPPFCPNVYTLGGNTLTDATLMDRQEELEADMVAMGVERYRSRFDDAMKYDRFGDTYPGSTLTKLAIEKFATAIDEWRHDALSGKRGRRNRAALKIDMMDVRGVAYVAIKTIFSRLYKRDTLTALGMRVGKAVMDEHRFQKFAVETPWLFDKIEETGKQNNYDFKQRRSVLIYSMNKFGIAYDEWTKTEKLQLGVKLIELFEDVSGFIAIETQPAPRRGQIHVVAPTEAILKFVEDRNAIGEMMRPNYLPTVVPPMPWGPGETGGYHMGYLRNPPELVGSRADNDAKADDRSNMPLVYDGLNAIQDTPWQVNRRVLSVLSTMWEDNMELPGVPSRENIPIPPHPSLVSRDGTYTPEEHKAWKKRARDTYDTNSKSQGRRLQIAMTLNMAERMKDDAAIYFPHHLDFRGRCYPLPSCLSPQGSDYSRALLEFANGKPLGDWSAVRWLAIHGANVFGEDKIGLEERVQWTYDHEEEILWCAEDPLKFDWWHQADKPFSFLAFCYEWQGFKRHGMDHVSRLPIALDGTCNGLQHFSAMLRDAIGGAAVNLVPADKPSDIYGIVAERVRERLQSGGFTGKEALWAETWLSLGIDRKMTKRPVMVLPYGGTFQSCRKYVDEAYREKLEKGGTDPFGDDHLQAVSFLSKEVWEAMGEKIVAARAAMGWLQKVARLCAKHDLTLRWTVPSGFTVHQKYVKQDHRRVKTQLYGEITYLSFLQNTDDLAISKQALAVAPNFVHSLDAAAMMLTIYAAMCAGIYDFAMIHDSYGTLAADTEKLSRLIRQSFVKMYLEHDVLEEFRDDILAILPEEEHRDMPPLPPRGSLDIEEVLKSDFFFS